MGQVPADRPDSGPSPYGFVGDGRLSRHWRHYFTSLGLPWRLWSRAHARANGKPGVGAAEALADCPLILLAVSDDAIAPVLARLRSDLTVLCEAALAGRLDQVQAEWDTRAALGVVIAAGGYPDEPRKGDVVRGLDRAAALPGKLFHAGTALKDGQVVTSGGRVFCAVGLGDTVLAAQQQAYALVDVVQFDGAQARRDIGHRAIARERQG